MVRKFISLAMVIASLDVYLQSQLHPNDPIFYFVSNGFIVNICMIALAYLATAVSFRKKLFKSWCSFVACGAAAAVLGVFGLAGLFLSDINDALSSVLLPLNYFLILDAAVVMGICTLSYRHASRPAFLSQRLAQWTVRYRTAFPALKTPHSPHWRHSFKFHPTIHLQHSKP